MDDLHQRIESLSPNKRKLFLRKLRDRGIDIPPPPLKPTDHDGEAPLSFAQQRLWYLDRIEGDSTAYHIPLMVRLEGDVDPGALKAAIATVVERHQVLRTRFVDRDGEPVQIIDDAPDFQWQFRDVSGGDDVDDQIRRCTREAILEPFDLCDEHPIRAELLQVGCEEFVLAVVIHHIATDGWSNPLFAREVLQVYGATVRGEPPELCELPVQYADFATWQRKRFEYGLADEQIDYWKHRLEGLRPLQLPTDHRRPSKVNPAGDERRLRLSPQLAGRIEQLADDRGATVFMVLVAACQMLLSRYSGQSDLAVGAPVAGRRHADLDELIGFFVNTLVLRADLSANPTFGEFLDATRNSALEAMEHQEVPFERLVAELDPEREPGRNPLFQVLVALQNNEQVSLDNDHFRMTPVDYRSQTAQFELNFQWEETADALVCRLVFSTDLFAAETIDRMLGHLENLLEAIVADPQRPVGDYDMIGDDERRRLIEQSRGPRFEKPRRPVHRMFERRAAQHPQQVALRFDGGEWTYEQLNTRANAVAHGLMDAGVKPGRPVGVSVQRSPQLVAALLGVMKAGGWYVALPPDVPQQRISYMVTDAGAGVVVADGRGRAALEGGDWQLLAIGEMVADSVLADSEQLDNPSVDADVRDLNYVLYTSGTTGQPKGVMMPHRAVANHVRWLNREFDIGESDVFLLKSSYGFDVSVSELFVPLCTGGVLAVAEPGGHRDPQYLVEATEQFGVTCLRVVPTALNLMLDRPDVARLDETLDCVILAGEALTPAVRDRFFNTFDNVRLYNLYGTTETCIDVNQWECTADRAGEPVDIGGPMGNYRLHLLDEALNPVPEGVAGEMCVGGTGVGYGYWNRPKKTAEAFVPDPYGEEPGARLYRTGDLGTRSGRGELYYSGRRDHQLQVRGVRVELAEIEARLEAAPGVRQAAVRPVDERDGNAESLVGYVVAESGSDLEVGSIRQYLQQQLRQSVVPGSFVQLDEFPRNASGKIDRGALPEPEGLLRRGDQVAPRDDVEQTLARIWEELLDVDDIGVNENFFEVGGDSIISIQVASRAREQGLFFEPRALFEHATIAELARVAATEQKSDAQGGPGIEVSDEERRQIADYLDETGHGSWEDVEDIYPLSPLQRGMLYHVIADDDPSMYWEQYSFDVEGPLDVELLKRAWRRLVDRHAALRTAFVWEAGDRWMQLVFDDVEPPWIEKDWRDVDGDLDARIDAFVAEQHRRGTDLREAPPLRLLLIRTGESSWRHVICSHHIVYDGWCLPIVYRELWTIYTALAEERPVPLDEAPEYRDYIDWVHRQNPEDAAEFWADQLDGVESATVLPRDRRESMADQRQQKMSICFGEGRTEKIERFARRHRLPVNVVVQGAFALLLSRLTGDSSVLYGATSSGRTAQVSGIEQMVGLLINSLPRHVEVPAGLTTVEWLRKLREQFMQIRSYEYVPLAKVRQFSDMPSPSLFEYLYIFENYPALSSDGDLAGVSVEMVDAYEPTNYPLILVGALREQRLSLRFEFYESRFDRETIGAMLDGLDRLLDEIIAAAEEPVARIDVSAECERREIIEQLCGVDDRTGEEEHLLERLESHAESHPDKTAVVGADLELNYGELERRSDRLAAELVDRGVEPEQRVGLACASSVELVVAMVAVMKAGAAFVTLDPAYPPARIDQMIDDAGIELVLVADRDVDVGDVTTLDVRQSVRQSVEANESQSLLERAFHGDPQRLAYVVYTSGSTGRPKGVMVQHGGLWNLAREQSRGFGLDADSRVLQFASPSFDAAVSEVFTTLYAGATLLVDDVQPGEPLRRYLRDQNISAVTLPPSVLAVTEPEELDALETVISAGEACTPELVEKWGDGRRFINAYGPSEVTVCATMGDCAAGQSVHVGDALGGAAAYVLDGRGEPVDRQVPGELAVGGTGVGRGYMGEPVKTALAFVPDPFADKPGARMYRTGDRVKVVGGESARLEFLGRIDDQVKVRGYRVEPGEVAAVLESHPAVDRAVVDVRGDRERRRLVAWAGCRSGEVGADELLGFLRRQLPSYLVPSALEVLEELPLTNNAKIDRDALTITAGADQRHQPPRDDIELQIAGVFEEVLEVDDVDIHADFFELGGQSLSAVEVAAKLQQVFDVSLRAAALESHRSVAELARLVRGEATAQQSPLVRLSDGGEATLVLFHPVGGEVFCYRDLAEALPWEVWGVRQGEEPWADSLSEMARSHVDSVIDEIHPRRPLLVGGWSMGGLVATSFAAQLQKRDVYVDQLVLLDSYPPQLLDGAEMDEEQLVSLIAAERMPQLADAGGRDGDELPSFAKPYMQRYRHNIEALSRWECPDVDLPVTALFASDGGRPDEGRQAWSQLLNPVQMNTGVCDGNHFNFLRSRRGQQVADQLMRLIDQSAPSLEAVAGE